MANGARSGQGSRKQHSMLSENLLITFYRLTQTARMYHDNNPTLIECVENFQGVLNRLGAEEDQVTVQISNGRFFVQNEKLAYQRKTAEIIQNMLRYFESRNVPGLRLSTASGATPVKELLSFARKLDQAERQPEPLEWLMEELDRMALGWVELVRPAEQSREEQPPLAARDKTEFERRRKARRTYSCALSTIKDVAERIASQKRVGSRKAIRIVQNMVDIVMVDEPVLVGLSTLRDYDDYTFSHSVNVAILSMCLGKRLGLSRKSLERLGTSGLFHDLGKVEISKEILNKPGRLSDEEYEEVKKHPLNSVRQIIKMNAARELKFGISIPPFEHHLRDDLSAYPQSHRKKPVSLFGRILSIADTFDAMTTPRVYRPVALSPDRALGLMLEGAGRFFDPLLLKVFINMLGRYPIGTLLQLDDGHLGIVVGFSEGVGGAMPLVMLISSDGQGGFSKGEIVDLAEKDPQTDVSVRKIIKSLHPANYGIQPAAFLFA